MPDPIRMICYQEEYGENGPLPEGAIDLRGRGSDWQEEANRLAAEGGELILFLAAGVEIPPCCISAMQSALAANDRVAGVSPNLLSKDGKSINWLGYAFDSQLRLNSLYEGIQAADPLAEKPRKLQFAYPAAFMARRQDFVEAGGLDPAFGQLSFFNLCLRLARLRSGYFTTAGFARHENRLAEAARKGFWDSLVMRGKLLAGSLAPDYADLVRSDGFGYGISEWLAEGPELDIGNSAWLGWRRDPSPRTLLSWLAELSGQELAQALSLCRQFPAILPAQFHYYEVLAESQTRYAAAHGLDEMAEKLAKWQKRARSFHYGTLRGGMRALEKAGVYKASLDRCPAIYDAWLELSPNAQPCRLEPGSDWPQIAVAMPVYNPEPDFLRQALDSVRAQTYANWRLCIADDASTRPGTRELLEAYAAKDGRVRIKFRNENGHISRATNSALELAQSPYVAFMDQDDMLAPDALGEVASKLAARGDIALAFTDSDHIDENNIRRTPYFKPYFDPELEVTGHLSVYAARIACELGGLRPGFEGSQDYDLLLRAIEICNRERIIHVPKILYHWRVHGGSTAATSQAKPYIFEATQKALAAALERRGIAGRVVATERRNYYLPWRDYPSDLAASALLRRGARPASALLTTELIRLEEQFGIQIHYEEGSIAGNAPKSWLKLASAATPEQLARKLHCEVALILASALEPARGCMPEQTLIQARELDIALVGGMFWAGNLLWQGGLYPNRTGLLFPLLRGARRDDLPGFCWAEFLKTRETLSISPLCFAIRPNELAKLQGFEQLTLTEFCLSSLERGRRTLVSPWNQWRLTAPSAEEAPIEEDRSSFLARWGEFVAKSGLRNPNLEAAPDNDWTLILS